VWSMPPRTSAAPTCPWCLRKGRESASKTGRRAVPRPRQYLFQTYWKRYCLSIVMAVATRGGRPVDSSCNLMLDEIMLVVLQKGKSSISSPLENEVGREKVCAQLSVRRRSSTAATNVLRDEVNLREKGKHKEEGQWMLTTCVGCPSSSQRHVPAPAPPDAPFDTTSARCTSKIANRPFPLVRVPLPLLPLRIASSVRFESTTTVRGGVREHEAARRLARK
jgi:hypothetical protein